MLVMYLFIIEFLPAFKGGINLVCTDILVIQIVRIEILYIETHITLTI